MSRTLTLMLFGFIAVATIFGLALSLLLVGRSYLTVATRTLSTPLGLPATAVPTSTLPSPTPTVVAISSPTAVVPPATATQLPTATTPPTAVPVLATTVEYILALTDVNIRSGPGTSYSVMGWVAGGQTAQVTGISSDGYWWRVICPNGSIGSCWATARRQYTQPASAPATVPAACGNSAALVADVTVPDGSQFAPNTAFVKTWRLKNTGTCTWDGRYRLIHHAGSLLGAVGSGSALPGTVAPGQTIDLSVQLVSPAAAGSYQSDWLLESPQGQPFGVGRSSGPFWVKIVVSAEQTTTFAGLIYGDANQNGIYDTGDVVLSGREVRLIPGTACQVQQAPVATTHSDSSGRFTISGSFAGSYCVGMAGDAGLLDDVVSVTVTLGQTLNNINLKGRLLTNTISGFVWNDYCLLGENGDPLEGSCLADGTGGYHADGLVQPGETNISGVTITLQFGACATDNPAADSTITDGSGRYTFSNLLPGLYCVSTQAALPQNAPLLLPGDWTFPARGIWYQAITVLPGSQTYTANFGWDYQLK